MKYFGGIKWTCFHSFLKLCHDSDPLLDISFVSISLSSTKFPMVGFIITSLIRNTEMFVVPWRVDQNITNSSYSSMIIRSMCFLQEAGDCEPVILAPELNPQSLTPWKIVCVGGKNVCKYSKHSLLLISWSSQGSWMIIFFHNRHIKGEFLCLGDWCEFHSWSTLLHSP